jgi:hypothetical protein
MSFPPMARLAWNAHQISGDPIFVPKFLWGVHRKKIRKLRRKPRAQNLFTFFRII